MFFLLGVQLNRTETIRYKPWAEPDAANVTFLPKMIEPPEPAV
jgi:hypothetical protein